VGVSGDALARKFSRSGEWVGGGWGGEWGYVSYFPVRWDRLARGRAVSGARLVRRTIHQTTLATEQACPENTVRVARIVRRTVFVRWIELSGGQS
jgi:hypothetical protein